MPAIPPHPAAAMSQITLTMTETLQPEIAVRTVDGEDEVAVEMTIASVALPAVDTVQPLQDLEAVVVGRSG